MTERHILNPIIEDLERQKMILISGPRQCGKTTLARSLSPDSQAYYNWDVDRHRKQMRESALDPTRSLWVLDEIHKNPRWRNWLKGIFDVYGKDHKIVVTGSARIDQYSRGGDSLQGRYFHMRLHPFTLSEVISLPVSSNPFNSIEKAFELSFSKQAQEALLSLLKFGGFPEPFLSQSQAFAGRWRLAYGKRLVREDVRDLEKTQQLDLMESLYGRLPDLISSQLSINNLSFDLEVAHQTVSKWIAILEKMYANFYVLPYGSPKIKAIKKEKKLFLWDWARIEEPGPRLENLVALHLLRFCHWCEDVLGEEVDLRYVRDVDGHEIDFLLLKKRTPWIAIEVKNSQKPVSTGLKYLVNKLRVPLAYQIELKSDQVIRHPHIGSSKVFSVPVSTFLQALP